MLKRDTSSNWTSYNPVIKNGEIVLVDTTTGELRAKIGDGSKKYTELPFSDEVIRNLIETRVTELDEKISDNAESIAALQEDVSSIREITSAEIQALFA